MAETGRNTLTIRDNRTGKDYEVPIQEGDVVRAIDLRKIKVQESDFGMMAYDPAFSNTAFCRSAVTYIDGGEGILRYRGYPIEQLAEHSSFLEVAHLLLRKELPTKPELDAFVHDITYHTYIHENILKFLDGFRYDAHAMGILISAMAALSTFYPESKEVHDPRTGGSRSTASWPSSPPWLPSPTGITGGCRTCIRRTNSPTRPTS
jgi:citrate synthase